MYTRVLNQFICRCIYSYFNSALINKKEYRRIKAEFEPEFKKYTGSKMYFASLKDMPEVPRFKNERNAFNYLDENRLKNRKDLSDISRRRYEGFINFTEFSIQGHVNALKMGMVVAFLTHDKPIQVYDKNYKIIFTITYNKETNTYDAHLN